MSSCEPLSSIVAKPENGLRGLKYWRYNLIAGVQVALIGLPLSLGVAVSSGAVPITGVISAIIAGLVLPFLGGGYVTIGGPAATAEPCRGHRAARQAVHNKVWFGIRERRDRY